MKVSDRPWVLLMQSARAQNPFSLSHLSGEKGKQRQYGKRRAAPAAPRSAKLPPEPLFSVSSKRQVRKTTPVRQTTSGARRATTSEVSHPNPHMNTALGKTLATSTCEAEIHVAVIAVKDAVHL